MNVALEVVRLLYLVLFLLAMFPVGSASGLYFVSIYGTEKTYWLGFAVGILFLASPFIVSSARSWVSRKRREASPDHMARHNANVRPGVNAALEVVRLLYLALFVLLVIPVGWASGFYFVTIFGNEKTYWLGFGVGTLFLASPFIVSSARRWVSRKRREAGEDA